MNPCYLSSRLLHLWSYFIVVAVIYFGFDHTVLTKIIAETWEQSNITRIAPDRKEKKKVRRQQLAESTLE